MNFLPVRDQSQFQSLLRSAILLPVFFALLVGGLFFWRVKNLRMTAHWVDHSDRAIGKAFELEKFMLESDTGLRGFIINRDPAALKPYWEGTKGLQQQFHFLEKSMENQVNQLERLHQMENASLAWTSLAEGTIALATVGRNHPEALLNSSGLKLMDQFRAVLSELIGAEQKMRDERSRSADTSERVAMMHGLLLSLLIGFFLTVFTRKSLQDLSNSHQLVLDQVELKAMELTDSESKFRTMANSAPILIWTAGPDKLCDWFSQAWLDFRGKSLKDELRDGWAVGVHPDDYQRSVQNYNEAFDQKKSFEMEYRLRRRDGRYRWILARGTPRISQAGEFSGYIGSCTDIHERIEQSESLKQTAEDLKAALRSRDDFLSVASHELKTPLTVLKLQLQLNARALKPELDKIGKSEKLDKFFHVCLDQTNRLDNLVEDLLDVTRIQQGKLNFHFEEFDLVKLVKEEVDQFSEPLKSAQCEVKMILREEVWIRGDRFRIEQVVVNLITNAMKYGAGQPVLISVEKIGKLAILKVNDQGIGIEEDKQEVIFDRFERVQGNQNIGGMGLGLFIAKQIVNAHMGSIHVKSRLGEGSTFTVNLPLESKEADFCRTNQELAKKNPAINNEAGFKLIL